MSEEIQFDSGENEFWDHAIKYNTSVKTDEQFVSEIAYVMTTLHRNGS